MGLVSFFVIVSHNQKRDESQIRKKNLPPGSHGLPMIGETWSFTQAMGANKTSGWIYEREKRYVHVFKTSPMGSPPAVIAGQAGIKFVLSADPNPGNETIHVLFKHLCIYVGIMDDSGHGLFLSASLAPATGKPFSLANSEENVTCNPFPYPITGLPIALNHLRKPIKI
ncbi:hypothetical protein ACLOJK_031462 [Asimina triloba]